MSTRPPAVLSITSLAFSLCQGVSALISGTNSRSSQGQALAQRQYFGASGGAAAHAEAASFFAHRGGGCGEPLLV